MSGLQAHDRLQLPGSLQTQLHDFRRRVWSIKIIESVCGAVFSVVVPFLALFAFDRLGASPGWLRGTLFALAVAGCATVPWALHRWVWRNRRLEELARLLSRKHPHVGDQLLGVIELVDNDAEQARSQELCKAAIEQVAHDVRKRDFRDAVPNPRHRLWSGMATVPALVALGLAVLCPTATANAWSRLLAPWQDIPRFTFAAFEPLPERLVVAHGEPFTFTARLASDSLSHPDQGTVQLGAQPPVTVSLRDGRYKFELPSQIESGRLDVRVGDFRQTVNIDPKSRPELTSIAAEFNLPEYLGLPEKQSKDVRGGVLTLVNGSRVALTATASRNLANGTVDGASRTPREASLTSPEFLVDGARRVEFQWIDEFGLAGKEPFALTMTGRDDEAPSLIVEDLPRHKVVIESEVLSFKIWARDDFGVKAVGIEWKGIENPVVKSPAEGERLLAAGGNDKESLDLAGTFSAKSLGIEPQPVNVRVFVEDYLPGRARVYSPPHTFYVQTAEQHAIWITEQMSKWHRQALEVRDRELQLYEANKQLRELAQDELDRPETRRRIENQANAERANGRRLSNLTSNGEELVKQAMRNPEIGVGHLEKWAEMLQVLKDISSNRMPSVADLLKAASRAPAVADSQPAKKNPMAGQIRASGEGKGTKPADKPPEPKPPVPQIVDAESSQQPKAKKTGDEEPPPPASNMPPPLRLPMTTVMGDGSGKKKPPATPAEEKVDKAIKEQQDLLAEFERIADELNRVLANLEGSTLVKRLKAASRVQYKIGGRIGDQLKDTFGVAPTRVPEKPLKVIGEMSEQEGKASLDVSFIMDDMQAYYERRHFVKFKTVLDDMRQLDVIGSLRQLGNDLRGNGQHNQNGMSLAQTEYWSDTLDRWAEDLVDPACCGACTGCKAKGSLPPSIVLEVLQILEGEINLRDETRVSEQARPGIPVDEHKLQGTKLSITQADLKVRINKVIERIRELPDGESDFAKEIKLLGMVSLVMNEATEILARPETGNPAIAAETEAIELLLQSKRINPKAGGGAGPSPGAGGGGTTQDSALTLVGSGANDKEVREDRGISQATGNTGAALPEEFRAGLDEYFNRLDRRPSRE